MNPYCYAGYGYDDATGLYYLNARYYNTSLGRFLSRDAVSSNNLYVYCYNNFLTYVDPSGHFTIWLYMYLSSLGTAPDTQNDMIMAADS